MLHTKKPTTWRFAKRPKKTADAAVEIPTNVMYAAKITVEKRLGFERPRLTLGGRWTREPKTTLLVRKIYHICLFVVLLVRRN